MTDTARPALTVLSEDEKLFAESVRDFARGEIEPHVKEMDDAAKLKPEILKACFDLGLMGIEVPEEYGGAGATFFMACLAIEELARVDPSLCVCVDVQNTLVNNVFMRWGSDEQKKKYLTKLATDTVGAYALSEAGSGSDAFGLETKAVADGDDWVLNGRKLWITNGNEADFFLVFANADPSAGYRGITAFVVERGDAGFTVGPKEDKLGIRASSTTELLLDDCRLSKDRVVGKVGRGYKVAIETLNEGRIGIGAQMVGIGQAALDHTIAYVNEREQFGKAIGSFQGVQFQIAEMAMDLEGARLMVYNAARLRDAGLSFLKEAAMAKLFSSQAAERITSQAVNLFGGYGFVRDYPVEKLYRDQKIGQIYEGTSNMQRQTIAKIVMG